MIIGHLPAGYLALKAARPRLAKPAFIAALIGSVLPDIDMLWFFLVDGGQTHHHHFLTHRPALWVFTIGLGVLISRINQSLSQVVIWLSIGALFHLCLDSIAGRIAWLWPVSDESHPLVVVPATQSHWLLSFMTHWTFAVEIMLTMLALIVFWRSRSRRPVD